MKVWITETVGGYVEVDSPEEAEEVKEKANQSGLAEFKDFEVTHREIDSWTE